MSKTTMAPLTATARNPVRGKVLPSILLGLAALVMPPATLQAQTFAPIQPLAFTKVFAGANPLPQTLTVNGVGGSLSFTTAVSTGSGGNWLAVAVGNGCGSGSVCAAPHSLTVIANPAVDLTAGTYSGQIVFTSYPSAALSITVPVTLTIAQAGTAFFDNMPGQLSFSFRTAGTTPPSQTIQVRNGGSGILSWTRTISTSDGGNWLTTSASSGAAPTLINVGITKANLPGGGLTAGTFTGRILFQTAGGGSVSVPIAVVVGNDVFRQVNPINFTKVQAGANPLPQTLTIASTGATFSFTTAVSTGTGGNWLTVDVGNGCGSGAVCGTPHALTVTANPAIDLVPGTYTGQIVFTFYSTSDMSMTVPVTLTIAPAGTPFFDNVPGQMSFSFKTAGVAPPEQVIDIRNGAATGFVDWTLTTSTSDGGNWLTASAASGTAPSQVAVGISISNLPSSGLVAGTFIGQLVFRTAGSSVTVPIRVTVGDAVFRQVNGISFTKRQTGADPLPQTLTIASTGAAFNFTTVASTSTGGDWLSVNVGNGCGSGAVCGTPHTLTVTANPSVNLAPGTYTGQIVVTSYSTSEMSMTVPVTLTVAAPDQPFFDNLPGQVSFSFKTAGATPPAQAIQIRNAGAGTLNWTASAITSDSAAWLNVSPSSGTAPSSVSISIVKANLPGAGLVPGTFTGQILFESPGGSTSVPVSVVVRDDVFSQANALSFTKLQAGPDPLPQTLTIASTGNTFNFTTAVSTATGGDWLSVSVGNGCGSGAVCATPHTLTVAANPNVNLTAGTYTGQIVVTSYSGGDMSMTIPVSLTIAPSNVPFFDDVQGQVSFSLVPAAANPASQIIQIRNRGAGTLNWTLERITSDSGNWLTVSAASGAAPSTVTVGVVANSLPGNGLVPGTFTGLLTFRSAKSSVTVPVSVTVRAAAFAQLASLNFSKQSGDPNPLPQTISIASSSATFNFTTAEWTATGGDWLNVSVGSGCGSGAVCGTPHNLTVSVSPAVGLAAGTYTGQIVVTSYSAGDMAMTIPVYLTVAGVLPPVCTITATSGSGQSTPINTPFANPLVATVKDASNNPCSGVPVTFNPPQGGPGGSFAGPNTVNTNAQGVATSPVLTANASIGSYEVTATAPSPVNNTAAFALTNDQVATRTTSAIRGIVQSALVDTAFASRFVAFVRDSSGNPVSGETVTFSAPTSGPSGTFAGGVNTAVTNAQGVATSAVFTANGTSGNAYIVTATVRGGQYPARYFLVNLPVVGCVTSITPGADTAPALGRTASFAVATPSGCAWRAFSSQPWLEIYPLNGTGSGTIEWTAYPNFGTTARTATATVGNRTFTITQAANTGTSLQRFVRLLYFSFLGRGASDAEVASQVNSGLSPTQLAINFLNSAEFGLGGRFTAGLYVGIIERDAEFSGWQFQRQALARGIVNQDQLVSNFINSAEFSLKYGSISNADFVRLMYQNILLRPAAPNEVNAWLNVLSNPANTRTIVARSFLNSPEFRNGTGPRLLAFLLYATLLLRDPSPEERAALQQIIADPTQLPVQLGLFANGVEIGFTLQ